MSQLQTGGDLQAESKQHAAIEQTSSYILESIADAFFAVDQDWNFTYVNSHAEQLLNKSRDKLIGKNMWELFPEAVGTDFDTYYNQAIRTGKTVNFEAYYAPLLTWFEVRAYPAKEGLSVYFSNVTERHQLEDKLKQSREEYRQIAERARHQSYLTQLITDNATLGLFMMDDNQRCTFMNPAAEKITGFTFEEISAANKPLHDIIHHTRPDGSHYPMADCPIDRALPQKNQTKGEDIFVHKSGSFYTVAFTASPIIEDGKPTGTVIEVRDTSEEKKNQLRKAELEQLTKALAEQRNTLIELNNAKDEFISLASHQLRTPATGVKQYLNMVIDGYFGTLNDKQVRMLTTANESNERQLKIIDDLLRVARADAGKIHPKFEKQNFIEIIEAVLREHASIFKARNQTVSFTEHPRQLLADADGRLIRMVIENIVDNASKYTHERKSITISARAEPKHIHISVTDEGVGINKRDMKLLFVKFSRIDNPLSTKVGGTGLGLYWCKKIVDLHQGTIEASSRKNHGTTFTITFPRRQQPAEIPTTKRS